jgi:hypothetical protein
MTRVAICLAALALLLLGCAPPEEIVSDNFGPIEGGLCRWEHASCIDDVEMLRCDEGEWTRQSCTEYCQSIGTGVSSRGCDIERATDHPDALCTCTPTAAGCQPGEGRCDDADRLGWCADDWTWQSSSCNAVCIAESLVSLGCAPYEDRATCLCTNVGTPCQGDTSLCATDSTLTRCEDGHWVEIECSELCGWAASCNPGLPGGAACPC